VFNCDAMDWFLDRAQQLGVEHRPPGPILLGRHLLELGMKPGPKVGEILKAVYEQQLDGTVTNLDQAIAAATLLVEPRSEAEKTVQHGDAETRRSDGED
jgi:tRNA nucleotidyltransferase (CCA-adding enzyme)